MRNSLSFLVTTVLIAVGLVGCDSNISGVQTGDQAAAGSFKAPREVPASLSVWEQSIVDALGAGEDPGAVLARWPDVGCSSSAGFFNNGVFVGFAGLFAVEGPTGICPLSNFERTNPDGTIDRHLQGRGLMFLVLPGLGFYGSDGSDVIWRRLSHEDGFSVFTVTGILSDGSQVRAQFVRDPAGDNKAANTLWVEGLGYVVGGPPGK